MCNNICHKFCNNFITSIDISSREKIQTIEESTFRFREEQGRFHAWPYAVLHPTINVAQFQKREIVCTCVFIGQGRS